jgi:hypothetical protein
LLLRHLHRAVNLLVLPAVGVLGGGAYLLASLGDPPADLSALSASAAGTLFVLTGSTFSYMNSFERAHKGAQDLDERVAALADDGRHVLAGAILLVLATGVESFVSLLAAQTRLFPGPRSSPILEIQTAAAVLSSVLFGLGLLLASLGLRHVVREVFEPRTGAKPAEGDRARP